MALEQALEQYRNIDQTPFMRVTITTDSKYAHGCMTEWRYKWIENGWLNSNGKEVANRDLIERALDLEAEVEENGDVHYAWVPREENHQADTAVNEDLDDMNDDGCSSSEEYSSPDEW